MEATPWNRKSLLGSFEESPSLLLSALVFVFDLALFGAGSALVLLGTGVALKLVGTLIVTAAIVRLFLVGHEACHGSFFGNAKLNSVCGRIAFLPSMTAFSLWEVGHNTAHHGFNNLKGRDQVWTPLSKAEFDAFPRYRQALERLYRCGLGWGAYYLIEMWWKKLYFASRKEIGSSRRKYKLDSLLVTAGALLWLGAAALAARATSQSFALLAMLAVVDDAVPVVERHHRFRRLPAPHEPQDRLVPEPAGMAAQPGLPDVDCPRAFSVRHRAPDA
jgi:omega-6 fatty acid desaturase (delta-12 desaturase)